MTIYFISILSFLSDSVSPGQTSIHQLFSWFLIVASLVFIGVAGTVLYLCFRYRAKRQDELPSQVFGNTRVEVFLTLLTSAVLGIFFYFTLSTMFDLQKPAGDQTADIIIIGHQWWWQINYPNAKVSAANEIHLPVGKKLLVKFKSADVIHDFWVPELGKKMDIIPGQTTHLWLKVDKAGTYTGACSEFCGAQHAWMRIQVIAQPPQQFKQWLRQHAVPAKAPQNAIAQKGSEIFHRLTCGNCHTISGTSAKGTIGPDLTHLASRKTLLTGLLQNNRTTLRSWLEDPQKIKKGAHMPRYILEDNEVNALVSYLEELQ